MKNIQIEIQIRSKVFLNFKFFHLSSIHFFFLFIFYYRRSPVHIIKSILRKEFCLFFSKITKICDDDFYLSEENRDWTRDSVVSKNKCKKIEPRFEQCRTTWNKEERELEAKRCHFLSYNKKRKTYLEKKRGCFILRSTWIYVTSEDIYIYKIVNNWIEINRKKCKTIFFF